MVESISLSNCSVASLHPRCFAGLSTLKNLDLSRNLFPQIPGPIFSFITQLETLSLSSNILSNIRQEDLHDLTNLRSLDLSNCSLQSIENQAFKRLIRLRQLHINDNRLKTTSAFNTLPNSLQKISLHDNPWHCDCKLSSLRLWMVNALAKREVEPLCHSPNKLFGYRIEVLSLTDFACLPKISPSSMFVSVPVHNNASLVCSVSADPSSEVSWTFNGTPVINTVSRIRILTTFAGRGDARSELLLTNITVENNGTYTCLAQNSAGTVQANYVISVEEIKNYSKRSGLDSQYFILILILICFLFVLIVSLISVFLLTKRCLKNNEESTSNGTQKKRAKRSFSLKPAGTGSMMLSCL